MTTIAELFAAASQHYQSGKRELAIDCLQAVLRLNPNIPEAHSNLGMLLAEEGRREEAVSSLQEAVRLKPDFVDALSNLGNALREQGRLEEAEAALGQALRYRPDFAEAHNNLALVCLGERYLDKALAHVEEALRLKPDYADARYNRSLIWLAQGDWKRGLPEYEFRWQRRERQPSRPKGPLWDGSPLDGRTILLHSEQGLGDTLQFVRYVPLVKERGGQTVLLCQAPIRCLLENVAGIDQLLSQGEPLPSYDLQAPLMSLPLIFGTTIDTVPARVPYLVVRQELIDKWRSELSKISGFRVGISWQGSPRYGADWQRSFPLARFEPLARVPAVRLISLQKGPGREQLAEARFPIVDFGDRLDGEKSAPFMDTAAVMHSLDLVICPDSALAHLAGAMGICGWVALSFMPDWRWLIEREDCPWYPAHRLFRQHVRGDWEGVFDRMTAELAAMTGALSHQFPPQPKN